MNQSLANIILEGNAAQLRLVLANYPANGLTDVLRQRLSYSGVDQMSMLHIALEKFGADDLMLIINKIDESEIVPLFSMQDSMQRTVLLYALIQVKDLRFIATVLNKLDDVALNQLLQIPTIHHSNCLMALAIKQTAQCHQLVLPRITAETMNRLLPLKLEGGENSLMYIIDYMQDDIAFCYLSLIQDLQLNQALIQTTDNGWTPLQLLCQKRVKLALALLPRITKQTLINSINIKNSSSSSYLHYAAVASNSELFSELVAKIPTDILNNALLQLNQTLTSALTMMLTEQAPSVVMSILNTMNPETLNQAAQIVNHHDQHLLLLAIEFTSIEIIQKILSMLEDRTINVMASKLDQNNESIFTKALQHHPSDVARQLLAHLQPDTLEIILSPAISGQNYEGWNGLNLAAYFLDESTFSELIDRCNTKTLDNAVLNKCKNLNSLNWSPIEHALFYQSQNNIWLLLNKLSDEGLDKAMRFFASNGSTLLSMVAVKLTPEKMLQLSQRISPATIELAFTTPSRAPETLNITLFTQLLFSQTPEVIIAVCNRVSEKTLSDSIQIPLGYPGNKGITPFMALIQNHQIELIDYFIRRLPREIINKTSLQQTPDRATAIHIACEFQRYDVLYYLMESLNDEAFSACMGTEASLGFGVATTPLQTCLSRQIPDASDYIIKRLTLPSLRQVLLCVLPYGNPPITTIIAALDFTCISKCLEALSPQELKMQLSRSQKSVYQYLLLNSVLDGAEAQKILELCS